MTQNHHPRPQHTSNDASSQAESFFPQFGPEAKFRESERAKYAGEGSTSGPHFPNAARVHSAKTGSDLQGGQSSITAPYKLNFLGFACDWIRLPVYGVPVSERLREILKAKKAEARESDKPVLLELGGTTWTVGVGYDGTGSNSLPYVLTCAGVTLALGDGGDNRPVAAITATGMFCGQYYFHELLIELKCIVLSVGVGVYRWGNPSRLDLRVDVSGLSVSKFLATFAAKNVVKRARTGRVEFGAELEDTTGLLFGKRGQDVYCRIYDKVAELKRDEQKQQAYLIANGLEQMPEVVTRVEFELRSEFFRETFVTVDVDHLALNVGALVEYLMCKWIRFCSHKDPNNIQNSKPASWWEWMTRKAIEAARVKGVRPKAEFLPPDPNKMAKVIRGCLSTACASIGIVPKDLKHAFEIVAELFSGTDEQRMKDDFWKKSDDMRHFVNDWIRRPSKSLVVLWE